MINAYEKEARSAYTKLLEMLRSEESSCWGHRLSAPDVLDTEALSQGHLTAPREAPKCQLPTRTLQLAEPKRAAAEPAARFLA